MPRMISRLVYVSALLAALAPGLATASPSTSSPPADSMAESASPPPVEMNEQESTTRGSVTIEGQPIEYTATVGDLILRDDAGEPTARMTYVAYLRDGVEDRVARPVTFAFNGGPGSASVWVHMAAFGPRRALLDDEGHPVGPPPGKLVENEFSVLDATDLVFIDPVETGWSRPAPGRETEEFTGYTNDVRHVGDFIRAWVTRNDRWASPKFVAGESYGTTRAAGLAQYLQDAHGMLLNGVCLISSVIQWQTKVFGVGNDLPYPLILPTYTAIAWYHGKLPDRYDGDLPAALRDAEEFALGEYLPALALGERLPAERHAEIRARLAELSGLSEDYLDDANLRVEIHRFTKELLRDEGRTAGRLDGRYTGLDRDDAGENYEFDPAYSLVIGQYVSLLKDYLRRELGFDREEAFRHSAGQRVRPWNYHPDDLTEGYNTNTYANYAETLRSAMHKNPALQVLVMSGYYDLATPYFASDYTVDHMQLDPAIRPNLKVAYYDAGHMMYVRREDHRKFREDYLQLIEDALSWTPPTAAAP